jgi:PBSX family phage terminase large subunit
MIEIRNEYQPSDKGILFHTSPAKIKALVGGMGSGKTRMAVEELNQLALEFPGIRMMIMRKTMPSLRETTMNEFITITPDELGHMDRKLDNFNYSNGSKILFRGLDEPAKMKSLEVAVILMDEADEFTDEDFKVLLGRVRLKNKKDPSNPYPLHLIMVLNPVDEEHWIYKTVVTRKDQYNDSGGILELHLSTYDNAHNLPSDYIPTLQATYSVDEQHMYIFGNWGTVIKGAPVFTDVFRPDLHVHNMKYLDGYIIQRGWDFGFNHPACVVRIVDFLGRKNLYYENLGDKEYLENFARRVLNDCERLFGRHAMFTDFCDPRGNDKSDKGQTSVEILNGFGIFPTGERGMKEYVEPGIRCMRSELSTLVQTMPLLTVSENCPIIISGLKGKYVRNDDGSVKKDGYYEHLFDAWRSIAYQDKTNDAVRSAMAAKKTQKRQPRNRHTGY